MFERVLRPPGIIGRLDPRFLDGIGEQFPDLTDGGEWYASGGCGNTELLRALEPLTKLLLKGVASVCGMPPAAIGYTVDTHAVPPQASQRPAEWHVDGGNCKSVVVANAQPTEFLIAEPDAGAGTGRPSTRMVIRRGMLFGRKHLFVRDIPPDGQLADHGLAVYQPKPYELTVMRHNIHRSPVNVAAEEVARTWIRATILRGRCRR